MITARPQKNLKTAKEYFRKHLSKGDYHSEGQTVDGWWFGKGAERLGLELAEPVSQVSYERLCDNLHPITGDKLTVRQRQFDRRVCYDFVVSALKSVAIMALTVGDTRIIAAHSEACVATMKQMEILASTRVRRGGQDGERPTGEIVASVFRHETSRALDPQLHTHFVVFNATWDKQEQRWKALQTTQMFEQMPFLTEVYRSELAVRLMALGYELRKTDHGFEIEGVSQDIIERFSKRRRAILAQEAKLTEELGRPLSNNARATLAHSSRQRKDSNLSSEEVKAQQRAQLSDEEFEELHRLVLDGPKSKGKRQPPILVSAAEAVDYAREHLFERHSVVPTHKVLQTARSYARYRVPLGDLERELASCTEFIVVEDMLTTRETLRQEQRLISLVNEGMGRRGPLNSAFRGSHDLTEEQQLTLGQILRAPDQVVGLRGGAGTGKTKLLHEVARGIEERQSAIVLAPTTAAVEVLRKENLPRAATVHRFLSDEQFQIDAQGKVLLVDEAGLLSTKDLLGLLEGARARGCRVVLSGDTRQHTGIGAGDALRLLEQRSTLRMFSVNGIRRQLRREYRDAIGEIAQGKGLQGLIRLEKLGAIHEVKGEERYRFLAENYVASLKAQKSALIVSPTWREIERVTQDVRETLKFEKLLGAEETLVTTHQALKWTRAQKRDLRNYQPDLVLNFYKGTKEFAPGEWAEVLRVETDSLHVRKHGGRLVQITKKQTACFDVAKSMRLPVANGERLLIQGNRKADGLFNGQMVTVKKVNPNGRILLTDGRAMAPDFRSFTQGYCVTSHAAQGRTVDDVYVAVDSQSIRAANLNQFYVSASRGRQKVEVFTDDLMFLRQAVTKPAARLSATELMERAAAASEQTLEERPAIKMGSAS